MITCLGGTPLLLLWMSGVSFGDDDNTFMLLVVSSHVTPKSQTVLVEGVPCRFFHFGSKRVFDLKTTCNSDFELCSEYYGFSVVRFRCLRIPYFVCRACLPGANRNEHQASLELEEASLLKEKRRLQAETLAVEELLNGLAEAGGTMLPWPLQLCLALGA